MDADRLRDGYSGRTVCLTGGAGFIGSHLAESLVGLGASVRVVDDLSTGRQENLAAIRSRIDFHHVSVCDEAALRPAIAGVDVVFHLAAVASVPRSVLEPRLYHDVNTTGIVNILEAMRAGGGRRMVFSSSSSVYGDQPELPKVETMCPDPRSPYAASKAAGEQYLSAYSRCYDLDGVSLRYFNIFGPRQHRDSPYAAVIPRFADALCHGRPPEVHGTGEQSRDFTHVANAVHANLLAGLCAEPLEGQPVNVAAGERRSVLELLQAVARLLGVPAEYAEAPARPGDVQHSLASIDRAAELLGYAPIMPFEDGLRETVEWYGKGLRD